MNPSEPAADSGDSSQQSLESAGSVVESSASPNAAGPASDTGAPSSHVSLDGDAHQSGSPAPPPPKQSAWKRLWQKMNLYLLLFVLVVLVTVGVAVFATIESHAPVSNTLSSQGLSSDALKQLSNSDTTIGTPKQTLNVNSNAVFAGALLVRNNLEVAGTLKVGGNLSLPGIVVSGTSRFGQLQADTLAIAGDTSIQGILTAQRGLKVTGDAAISGAVSAGQITTSALQLNGDFTLTRHLTAGGGIPSLSRGNALGAGGTATVGGSDTAGSLNFNTGSSPSAGCLATITFTRAFASAPHVLVTPVGSAAAGLKYYVNRGSTNFSVCTADPAPAGQTIGFDYFVVD